MSRSVLGPGLLVTVYRAALSVAAPGREPGKRPFKHRSFRAEKMKIDNKRFQNVKFFQIFIKVSLKSFKIFKIFLSLTNFSQITIINLI